MMKGGRGTLARWVARAFQVNDLAGTFAGIGMALNALATAIIVPLLWQW